MGNRNKSARRNLLALASRAAGTYNSAVNPVSGLNGESDMFSSGIRLYIYLQSNGTTGSGADTVALCAVHAPSGIVVPMYSVSLAAGKLEANSPQVFIVDFVPGAYVPSSGFTAGSNYLGAVGLSLPVNFCAQLVVGTGNTCNVSIDAELLPLT